MYDDTHDSILRTIGDMILTYGKLGVWALRFGN
jgi:hypothetical protein